MSEDLGKEIVVEAAKAVAVEGYKDTLHPTLKTVGSIIALPFQAIDAALSKPKLWVAEKHYNYERTLKLLAEKLEYTSEELIVPPENYVAVPALQQIAYCFDSDELRDMYANLLANSMNKVVKDGVHPGFVEIIKQLSPDEAKILRLISLEKTVPTITVKLVNDVGGEVDVVKNFSNIGDIVKCEEPLEINKYFDNLIRLGLIKDVVHKHLLDESLYVPLKEHNYLKKFTEGIINNPHTKIKLSEGFMELTDYGASFCKVCLSVSKTIKTNIK